MYAVVEDNVHEIRRTLIADRSHRAEAHDGGSVAIDHDHTRVRTSQCNAEADTRGAAHGADQVQLIMAIGFRVEFTTGITGRRNHQILLAYCSLNGREHIRTERADRPRLFGL